MPFESVVDLCFNGGHNSSLINSIFRGSTWQICPRKELPKQRTQALETRVLIKSRILKTRDASLIQTFKTGQLTKLLEILCYLERVFFHPLSQPLIVSQASIQFSLSLKLESLILFSHLFSLCGVEETNLAPQRNPANPTLRRPFR